MRHRLQLCALLVAWLLAAGGHWDIVQVFGWGRMIVTYSQGMPLTRAIKLTFTAENLCGVCETVSEARQEHGLPAGGKAPGKIHLFVQPLDFVLHVLDVRTIRHAPDLVEAGRLREAPPTPPPRGRC